ncbi:holin family protein [Hwanghaeella sp. LZ110]|uniref:holin family protein n=1 Tax=Hwanghaeella sp. LZ110 TaxID=3402810 RepID=UPI003B66D1FA
MISEVVKGIAGPLFGLVDSLFTSDEERAAAKLKLMEMEQRGELETMRVQMSAILAEANSKDPWTSRARPAFLYVIYIIILSALPMGILSAFRPDMATEITLGVNAWLSAIPDALWTLFGAGYLGYAGARTVDKLKGGQK